MKPNYSIQVIEPPIYAGTAADEVTAAISDIQADKGNGTISIALAGGGTPISVYRALSIPPRATAVDWSNVDFYFGDERWVPLDDTQSNYKMANDVLLKPLRIDPKHIFPVPTGAHSLEAGTSQYESLVASRLKGSPIDLVLLGMGDDGHTASLFPKSNLLNTPQKSIFAPTSHPVTGQARVTMTAEAIAGASRIIVFVTGNAKASVLKHVLEGKEPKYPIQLLEKAAEKVTFVLDTEVYSER